MGEFTWSLQHPGGMLGWRVDVDQIASCETSYARPDGLRTRGRSTGGGFGADHRSSSLRRAFVARYGEIFKVEGAAARWNSDPFRPELSRLVKESNELCGRSLELLDAMIPTPATSLQGVHCKLLATISVMKCIELPNAEPEYHESMAMAVLRDAAQVLGNGAAA